MNEFEWINHFVKYHCIDTFLQISSFLFLRKNDQVPLMFNDSVFMTTYVNVYK